MFHSATLVFCIYSHINVVLHIPKTGGSSIRATFEHCKNFYFPRHDVISLYNKCSQTKYYAVLRNPYDRLFSSFTYYKYGSNLYNPRQKIATNLSFTDFLEHLSNSSSSLHTAVKRITTSRDWKNTPWIWADHFKAQTHWLQHCDIKIMCYSNNILHYFHNITGCNFKRHKVVNPTEKKVSWHCLTLNVKQFIMSKYKSDFIMYAKHCINNVEAGYGCTNKANRILSASCKHAKKDDLHVHWERHRRRLERRRRCGK